MTAHYKRLVLEFCRACNDGDMSSIDRYLTPDFGDLNRGTGPNDMLRVSVRSLRRAFTGARWDVLGLVGEGTTVVVRVRFSGIHTGEYLGVAPTGSRVAVEQVHIFEGRDGRLATQHCFRDELRLLGQLGVHTERERYRLAAVT